MKSVPGFAVLLCGAERLVVVSTSSHTGFYIFVDIVWKARLQNHTTLISRPRMGSCGSLYSPLSLCFLSPGRPLLSFITSFVVQDRVGDQVAEVVKKSINIREARLLQGQHGRGDRVSDRTQRSSGTRGRRRIV